MTARGQRRRLAAAILSGLLAFGLAASPALADPPPVIPTGPSDEEIAQARHEEDLAAASVAEIESLLDELRQRTAAADEQAGLAAENYNRAQVDLEAAAADEAAAALAVTEAEAELNAARSALARVAMAAAQGGTALGDIEPFLTSTGLADALQRAELIQIVGTNSGKAANRFAIAQQSAEAAAARATAAADFRAERADQAAEAADQAATAAAHALDEQAAAETEHQRLLDVLAAKRHTTAEKEAQREAARVAAENERIRLERERQALEAANRPPAAPNPPPPSDPGQSPTDSTPTAPPSEPGTDSPEPGGPEDGSEPTEPADPTTPPPSADLGRGTASAGLAAVEWARAQIGKPYQWGGSGPDSFDCSGLTSQAWLKGGGLWIQRVAADQYAAAFKINYIDMRPGDLIFWGTTATNIHHVALYSGNGMMIEAPRTGDVVKEIPIRWTNTYLYAGRV